MDKELIKIGYDYSVKVYKKNTDIKTTEYRFDVITYQNKPLQVLSIAGTNEFWDWIKNLNIRSKYGVKKVSYEAAKVVYDQIKGVVDTDVPLLATGHSKGGATALVYKKIFGADYCIAFCPARCMKTEEYMENTVMVIDPDDLVPKLGWSLFELPICERIFLTNNFGWSISSHFLVNMKDFIKNL